MEHGEKLSRGHQHVITEPTSDNRVVHNRLIRLVFEVTVPSASEMWCGPGLYHFKFFLGRTNLDTSFDAICGQWACAFEVPLVEDSFLDFRDTADEVVKGLSICLNISVLYN